MLRARDPGCSRRGHPGPAGRLKSPLDCLHCVSPGLTSQRCGRGGQGTHETQGPRATHPQKSRRTEPRPRPTLRAEVRWQREEMKTVCCTVMSLKQKLCQTGPEQKKAKKRIYGPDQNTGHTVSTTTSAKRSPLTATNIPRSNVRCT